MKHKFFLLSFVLVISQLNLLSQNHFFNFSDSNIIKVFYDYSGDITIEKYADFYRIATINKDGFFFDGEFSDFDKHGNKVFSATYKDGKLNGQGKYFFQNGKIKEFGNFKEGIRDSIWNFYHDNGEIDRVINFKNGTLNILSQFSKKGVQVIKEGTGEYSGVFYKENGKHELYKISGDLKNGKFNGKWKIPGVTMEKFKDGNFIEGFDVIEYKSPQQIYLKNILGYYCQENIDLFQNNYFCMSCIKDNSWHSIDVNFITTYKNFLSKFSNFLDSLKIYDYEQIVEFEANADGSISNINSVGSTQITNNLIIENLLKQIQWNPVKSKWDTKGYVYMMIVKSEGKIYTQQMKEITNDKEANFMLKQITKNNLFPK